MSVFLSPVGGAGAQFFDNNGNPLTGGKLYTYAAGTTTPQATYTSAAGSTFHTNPIVLDAAGRVPGSSEIWLADSQIYKFVLKDSNDVLLATWDQITGVNSNFVNYTTESEVQTATAGQTVFTLTTMSYAPGTGSLTVYVDGVNQYEGTSYVETNSTTVTFTAGLHVGALVKFTTAVQTTGNATDASVVTYDPPFTGSVATTVEAKLAQTVSVKDFGAVGDGVTDDTAAIQAAIDYCLSFGADAPDLLLDATYAISSSLIINRPAATPANSNGRFKIIGTTANAGFYMTGVKYMFENSIAGYSENIVFEKVWFQSNHSDNGGDGYTGVIKGANFIRVSFNDCYFQEIGIEPSCATYIQSFYLSNCKFVSWNGPIIDCLAFYDLSVIGCQFESGNYAGSKGFTAYDASATTSTQKATFISNLYENCQGPFVVIQSGRGVVVSGNYFEANVDQVLDFQQGTPLGVFVTGNSFDTGGAATTYAPILVSYPNGFYGAGNWSSTRLYRFLNEMQFSGNYQGGSWGCGDNTSSGELLSSTSPIAVSQRSPGVAQSFRLADEAQGLTYGYDTTSGNIVESTNTGSSTYLPLAFRQRNNSTTRNNLVVKDDGTVAVNISSSGVTLDENLTMAFFQASTTQLRIAVKCSDGVTRIANLTLT